MSDPDWEKSGYITSIAIENKFCGEDEDDDVKDNWDDDDPDDNNNDDTTAEVVPKKKTLAQKIADREKQIAEKRQAEAAQKAKALLTPEDILADKLEKQRLQEESDLKLAKEAFGVGATTNNSVSGLDEMILSSKDDFEAFRKLLVDKVRPYEKSAHYVTFLESLFRECCINLEVDDIKRLSSNVTAVYNEKIKAQKQQGGGKKKKGTKGAAIKVERSAASYDGIEYDEYDDFM